MEQRGLQPDGAAYEQLVQGLAERGEIDMSLCAGTFNCSVRLSATMCYVFGETDAFCLLICPAELRARRTPRVFPGSGTSLSRLCSSLHSGLATCDPFTVACFSFTLRTRFPHLS